MCPILHVYETRRDNVFALTLNYLFHIIISDSTTISESIISTTNEKMNISSLIIIIGKLSE